MTLAAVPDVHILPAVFGNVPKLGVVIAEQSLTALVEAEDRDLSADSLSSLAFPSLAEMAADEEGFEDA